MAVFLTRHYALRRLDLGGDSELLNGLSRSLRETIDVLKQQARRDGELVVN